MNLKIGRRFDSLVIKRGPLKFDGLNYYACRCDCGRVIDVWGVDLTRGRVKICNSIAHMGYSNATPYRV